MSEATIDFGATVALEATASTLPAKVPPPALSLYEIEEHLQALLDTEDMTAGEDQLAIMAEIAHAGELAKNKRDAVARFIRSVEAMASAKKEEAARLASEAKLLGRLQERLEERVLSLIEQFAPEPKRGSKKLEGRVFTLSARSNPPSVQIEPQAFIPMNLCNVTLMINGPMAKTMLDEVPALQQYASVTPDRKAIKALLDNEEPVEGCSIRQGKRLVIS